MSTSPPSLESAPAGGPSPESRAADGRSYPTSREAVEEF
jgi:hypothetical protein